MTPSPLTAARLALPLAGLLLSVIVFSGGARAVETRTFGMEPSPPVLDGESRQAFAYELGPGETARDAVRVFNKSRKTLRLAIYPVNATRKPDGSIAVGLRVGRAGPASWIQLDRQEVRLRPRRAARVGFAVRAPDHFPEKQQYLAAIAVEPVIGRSKDGVAVLQRLATVVYVQPTSALEEVVSNPLLWLALILLLLVTMLFRRVRRRTQRPP